MPSFVVRSFLLAEIKVWVLGSRILVSFIDHPRGTPTNRPLVLLISIFEIYIHKGMKQ